METSYEGNRRRLGSELRRLRRLRSLSLRQVAATIGLSPSTLSGGERGQRPIGPGTLSELRVLYEVPLRQLIAAARREGDDDRWADDGSPMIRFDFVGLEAASTPEGRLVAELVATIRGQRGAVRPSDGAIAIRRRDLRALSDLLEVSFDDFVSTLRDDGVLRNPVGRPSRAVDIP
jgi:transcriptional regulator with XRE-family HTH domain